MLISPFKHNQQLAGESETREHWNTCIHTIHKNDPALSCHARSVFSTSRRACKQLTKALGCPTLAQPVLSTRFSQSPQSQHTGNHWASITWKPLAQSRNRQLRVEESWTLSQNNNKMQNGIHSCEKLRSHAIQQPSYNLPSLRALRYRIPVLRRMKSAYNSPTSGSFHCCLHAVVPHCILCLPILHGCWIVRHDVQHMAAVIVRQDKVFPPQGNGNPSFVLNHSITTEDTSPCKPLFVVRLKPAMAIFETLMLPKQHLTRLWSFKMRSRKLHLLVSAQM